MVKSMSETKIPIAEIIVEYITDFCAVKNVAVFALDKTLLIMKKVTPKEWKEAQKILIESKTQSRPTTICSSGELSSIFGPPTFNSFVPNNDYHQSEAVKNIGQWGKKVPMINITEKEGTVQISYRKQLILDFRDPRFFDQLELVLDHVLKQDDLSLFSLPIENASCSIHYSQDCEHDPL